MPKDWRKQQSQDLYFRKAHAEGYRARSAYKLLEIDAKFHLLRTGCRVLDLGATPGSWSQVAARAVGTQGRVVALDLNPVAPLAGVTVLQGDARAPEMHERMRSTLGGPADVILSDMAPGTSGIPATDHARSLELGAAALEIALELGKPGAAFVLKVFEGPDLPEFLAQVRRSFRSVRIYNPEASRRESKETFVIALGMRPSQSA